MASVGKLAGSPAYSETTRDLFSLPLEELEQMTVTARKREEILQEVPVSVSVVTGALVEQQALENLADVSRYMPNTTLFGSQFTAGQLVASIRGTNFSEPEKSFESSVGVSIDGMFLGTATAATIELLDVDSIEVLRGPQGTLYGRNTIGGTINVRRTRPTGEFGYKLNARVGEHDRQEFGVVVNLPKKAGFATKLYAFSKEADLAADLENHGSESGQDWLSVGASMLWDASDTVSAQLTFDYVDDSSEYERVFDLTLSAAESAAVGVVPEEIPVLTTCDAYGVVHPSTCYSGNFAVQRADDFETSFGDSRFPFESSMDYWSTIVELNVDITPELLMTSITGYLSLDDKLIEPNVGARPLTFLGDEVWDAFWVARDQDYFQFSQELRLSSDFSEPINFVAGFYYLRSQYKLDGDGPPAVPATSTTNASPATSAFFAGTPAFAAIPSAIYRTKQDLDAYAVFGELHFDVSERLRLTGGLRLSYEEKNFFMDRWFLEAGSGEILPQFLFDDNDSWSEPTFRISADYSLADDTMGYASWARGFRSGGYDGRATTLVGLRDTYDPETVDSYELGIRSDLWDGRWRLNPTVFLTKYDDKQEERLISFTGPGGVPETDTITANASEATIWGIELETAMNLTDRLLIRGSLGYLDAGFDDYLSPNPLTGDLEDISGTAELRRAPEWTYNIGADYHWPLSRGSVTASVHHSYIDEYFSSPVQRQQDPLQRDTTPDDHRTDFFLSYELPLRGNVGQLSVRAFVLDAFGNKVRRLGGFNAGLFYFGVRRPEKQWGLEFTLAR
jgi:iron complex outermembrane receptor protein